MCAVIPILRVKHDFYHILPIDSDFDKQIEGMLE